MQEQSVLSWAAVQKAVEHHQDTQCVGSGVQHNDPFGFSRLPILDDVLDRGQMYPGLRHLRIDQKEATDGPSVNRIVSLFGSKRRQHRLIPRLRIERSVEQQRGRQLTGQHRARARERRRQDARRASLR